MNDVLISLRALRIRTWALLFALVLIVAGLPHSFVDAALLVSFWFGVAVLVVRRRRAS